MGITRLRESGLFPIEALAVISEESMIPLCEKYDIKYCFYKNLPLGEKLNYGLSVALKMEWDNIICIGSDDLLKNDLLSTYAPFLDKNLIALDSILFLNSETGGCRFVKTNSRFGAGRCFNRRVFDKVQKIWRSNANRSMDNGAISLLAEAGIMETRIKVAAPLVIDIKSHDSICDFNGVRTLGEKYPFDLAVEGLSEGEIEAIKSLQHVAV